MNVVVGDLLLDIFLLPELRAAEQGGGLVIRGGGSAANTASWLVELDQPAQFVGCVGNDATGEMLLIQLQRQGVQPLVRVVGGYESGAVAVEVRTDGERMMRSSRGANLALSVPDVAEATPTAAVHLTGYALLCPAGLTLLEAAGDLARRHGVPLSFDPSSESAIRFFGVERLRDAIRQAGVRLLLPNRPEAEVLTGETTPEGQAAALQDLVPLVVVSDGAAGCVCAGDGVLTRVPTEPVQPLDTTGAGDAFNAGVLAGLEREMALPEAGALGNATARRVLLQYGGRP